MSTVYLFNPENDMALASGSPYYMAPANIKKMAADLSALPAWYALPGSGVLVSDERRREWMLQEYGTMLEVDWMLEVPESCDRICPWGWNPALLRRLGELGVPDGSLLSKEQMSKLRTLSSRQMAVELLPRLRVEQTLGESNLLTSLENLKAFETKGERILLKSPWSGSGKGIRMVEDLSDLSVYGWAKRVISSQGAIVVEPYYNKVVDFAMEFRMEKGEAAFLGYSWFETDVRGLYKENLLASDEEIEHRLSAYVPVDLLKSVRIRLLEELPLLVGTGYDGCLGVDMMICRVEEGYAVHPCVEINLRMNMGIVARWVYDRHVVPGATGRYVVEYYPQPGEALRMHRAMQEQYPLVLEGQKIRQGYLSLTPVFDDTVYQVFVLVTSDW